MLLVWHFLNSSGGGVARYVEQLVRAQAARQQPPADRLIVTGPPELNLAEGVRHEHYRPKMRVWGLNQWRFVALTFMPAIRAFRIAGCITHAHNYILPPPDVFTVHGLYDEYRRGLFAQSSQRPSLQQMAQFRALRMLERGVLSKARRVVFVSTRNRRYVEDVIGLRRDNQFQVILPGVDTSRYHPERRYDLASQRRWHFPELDPTARWLLFVGHDFARKGLLRLLSELAPEQAIAKWQLLVFGNDPQNGPTAKRQALALGAERVHFFESDPRLSLAYGVSDCLLLPSVAEGFPLAVLEAMASGCAPVVTPFGGVSDIVVDGVNGIIVPNATEMARMAVSLPSGQLLGLSHQAVAAARRRTWDDVASDYAACYAELAQEDGA